MEPLAALIGVTICFMLVANAALQQSLGPVLALLVVHGVGLVLALPLAIFSRRRGSGPVPWPLFTGGLVGVALLLINNQTIPVLGAGLTVALGVVGQLAAAAVVDHLGLFGLTRRPVRWAQVGGLVLAGLGVAFMTLGRV